VKIQIAEENLRDRSSEGSKPSTQLLGSPGCWGRKEFRSGGQGTDAPDCVASGYWRTLSPADRKAVCIKMIRAIVTLGFLHVSSRLVLVLMRLKV
jgi:hypothetical protein